MIAVLKDGDGCEPVMGGLPFTRSMGTEHGLNRRRLDRLLEQSRIIRLLTDVYLDAGTADSVEIRSAAVALVLPRIAAVSGLTAGWLWGVDARGPDRWRQPCPLVCTVGAGQEPISRPGVVCRVAPLDLSEITEVNGVPCTTPLRTTIDVMRAARPHIALGTADAMAFKGLIGVDELVAGVERWAGYRGVVQARRLAPLVEPLTESFGESWTRLRIIDAGFPRPQPQIWVRDGAGRPVYRLDLGWEELRKAIEYDGQEFHSEREARDHDDGRREELRKVYHWDVIPAHRGDILGRSLRFEYAVGELLGLQPQIHARAW